MFVTVFYVVVFISGLLGNLSVIAVVVRSKGLHSAMNYYLISLAIADILIIILGELYQVLVYFYSISLLSRTETRQCNAVHDIVCWYNNVFSHYFLLFFQLCVKNLCSMNYLKKSTYSMEISVFGY